MAIFPGRRIVTRYVDVTRGRRERRRGKKKRTRSLPEGVKAPRPTFDPKKPRATLQRERGLTFLVGIAVAVALLLGLNFFQIGWVADRGFPVAVCVFLVCCLWVVDVFAMKKERLWRRTKLRPRARMRFGERGLAATCAYCHTAFSVSERVECPACEAAYHADCVDELGGCATLGCAEARQRVRLTHPAQVKKT